MSWYIALVIDTGKGKQVPIWENNMTFNVSSMYYDAIEIEGGFRGFNGLSSRKVAPILKKAIQKMVDDPEKYRAMEPSNEWGTYEQALNLLKDILVMCDLHPLTTILIE